MPASMASQRRKLLRNRTLRTGLPVDSHAVDVHHSPWVNSASARRAALWDLHIRPTQLNTSCANNDIDTPPATASPPAYETPRYSDASVLDVFRTLETMVAAPVRKATPSQLESKEVNPHHKKESAEKNVVSPSPESGPPTVESKNVWVWPSREGGDSRPRRGGQARSGAGRKREDGATGGEHANLQRGKSKETAQEDESVDAISRKKCLTADVSFESTCSTVVLSDQPSSTRSDAQDKTAAAADIVDDDKKHHRQQSSISSIDGASLDAPFLSHLCDMSMRFPEPPTAPPSSRNNKTAAISKTGLKAIDFGLPLLVPMKLRKRALIGVPGQAGGAMRKTILASPADPPLSVRRRRNSATKIKHRRSRPSPHVTNSARFTFQSALVAAATEQKPFASLHVPTASTFTTDEGVGAEPSPSSEEERDTCSGEVRENSPPKIIWTPASLKKPHHGLRLDLPSHRFDVSADAENLCPSDQESGDTEAYSPTPSPTPSPGNIDRLRRPFAQAAPDAVAFWESREAESASPVQFKRMSMPMKRVARQRTTAAVGAARWNSWSALPENFAVGGQLKTSE